MRLACGLREAGIGPSDRVAVVLPNGPDMAAAFVGVAAAAACAPLNPSHTRRDFEFYLSDLRAKALLWEEDAPTQAPEAARSLGIQVITLRQRARAGKFDLPRGGPASDPGWPGPGHVALLLHTSGTTSRPKLVPLSAANLTASAAHIANTLALGPSDRCLNIMPLFHIHGLMAALLASLGAGASVVCTDGVYSSSFFEWMRAFQPSWYTAVPTMHQGILGRAREHAELIHRVSLRFIRSSSAPLPPSVLAELEEVFQAPVIEAYGMTEAAHQIASNPLPPARRKPGSVGLAAGPEAAIMDEAGRLLPPVR
jgi:acyl-CoA synthetase (AMP-forming)/AMP-acid ligase II